MSHPSETKHGPEAHCESCARDQRRADILTAAVEVIGFDDDRLEGFVKLRESAVKILQKAFDEEVLPKGLA